MGKPSPPPMPDRLDPGQVTGEYLFGSDFQGAQGITDRNLQQRLVDTESEFGRQYVANELGRQQTALFGQDDQPGLLAMFSDASPVIEDMRASTARSQRESDLRDIQDFGQQYVSALRGADPAMQGLLDQQRALTSDLYDRAGGVTPEQRRIAQQGAREASAARGRVMDSSGIAGELLGREEMQRMNRAEAQQAGGNLFGMLAQTGADPSMAVLGRASQSMPYTFQSGNNAANASRFGSPQMFNQDTGLNMAMARQGQEMQYNADVFGAQQARSGAIIGGALGGLGTLGGGFMGTPAGMRMFS